MPRSHKTPTLAECLARASGREFERRLHTARYYAGIDLGTTNSSVTLVDALALLRGDADEAVRVLPLRQHTSRGVVESPYLPSVVAEVEPGEWWVGHGAREARSRGLLRGRQIFYSTKLEMGLGREPFYPQAASPEYDSPYKVAGRILQEIREALEEEVGAEALNKVVVTVPASFQLAARKDTFRAARLAGLELQEQALLDEPNAAFLDYVLTGRSRTNGRRPPRPHPPPERPRRRLRGRHLRRLRPARPRRRRRAAPRALEPRHRPLRAARGGQHRRRHRRAGPPAAAPRAERPRVPRPHLHREEGADPPAAPRPRPRPSSCASATTRTPRGPALHPDRPPAARGKPPPDAHPPRPGAHPGAARGGPRALRRDTTSSTRETASSPRSCPSSARSETPCRTRDSTQGDVDALLLVGGSTLIPQVRKALTDHFPRAAPPPLRGRRPHPLRRDAAGRRSSPSSCTPSAGPSSTPSPRRASASSPSRAASSSSSRGAPSCPTRANGEPAGYRGPRRAPRPDEGRADRGRGGRTREAPRRRAPEGAPRPVRRRADRPHRPPRRQQDADRAGPSSPTTPRPTAWCSSRTPSARWRTAARDKGRSRSSRTSSPGRPRPQNPAHDIDRRERLAFLYQEERKYERAIDEARKAMEADRRPEPERLLNLMAGSYDALGASDRAEKHYREAIRVAPASGARASTSRSSWSVRAASTRRSGWPGEAVRSLSRRRRLPWLARDPLEEAGPGGRGEGRSCGGRPRTWTPCRRSTVGAPLADPHRPGARRQGDGARLEREANEPDRPRRTRLRRVPPPRPHRHPRQEGLVREERDTTPTRHSGSRPGRRPSPRPTPCPADSARPPPRWRVSRPSSRPCASGATPSRASSVAHALTDGPDGGVLNSPRDPRPRTKPRTRASAARPRSSSTRLTSALGLEPVGERGEYLKLPPTSWPSSSFAGDRVAPHPRDTASCTASCAQGGCWGITSSSDRSWSRSCWSRRAYPDDALQRHQVRVPPPVRRQVA